MRTCISQHGQHQSGPGATACAQPSLGCHLPDRCLTKQTPSFPALLLHDSPWVTVFIIYIKLSFSWEQSTMLKIGQETLKINQCWYMDVWPYKGVDQCIQILPAETKASFQKDKLSLWRHALPFHRQPSSGRSLQESHGDSLGLQHLPAFLGTSLCTKATKSTQLLSWRGRITLPYGQGRETAGLIPESWVFLVDRQICSGLSFHSMDLTMDRQQDIANLFLTRSKTQLGMPWPGSLETLLGHFRHSLSISLRTQ